MPLFVHRIEGGIAQPHVNAQGVEYLRCWVNEATGQTFCLVDAPNTRAAKAMHHETHGLQSVAIYPVIEAR